VRSPMSANPKPVEHSRTMLADELGYEDRQLNDLSGRGILGGGWTSISCISSAKTSAGGFLCKMKLQS